MATHPGFFSDSLMSAPLLAEAAAIVASLRECAADRGDDNVSPPPAPCVRRFRRRAPEPRARPQPPPSPPRPTRRRYGLASQLAARPGGCAALVAAGAAGVLFARFAHRPAVVPKPTEEMLALLSSDPPRARAMPGFDDVNVACAELLAQLALDADGRAAVASRADVLVESGLRWVYTQSGFYHNFCAPLLERGGEGAPLAAATLRALSAVADEPESRCALSQSVRSWEEPRFNVHGLVRALECYARDAAVAEPLGRAIGRLALGDDPLARCLRGENFLLPARLHFCEAGSGIYGAVNALIGAMSAGGGSHECSAALDALGFTPTGKLNPARAAACAQRKADGEQSFAAAKRAHARVLSALSAPLAAGALVATILVHADAGAGDADALFSDSWVCVSAMDALAQLWKSSPAGAAAVAKADDLPRAVGAALAVHFASVAACRAAESAAAAHIIGTGKLPDIHGWTKVTYSFSGDEAVSVKQRIGATSAALASGLDLALRQHGRHLFDEVFLNVPRLLRGE
jgi:hypothetical protein